MPQQSARLNNIVQTGLTIFTITGFIFTSLKLPQYGLLANLVAQVFWLRSAYLAWQEAGQYGIFITSIFITIVVISGIINYWFLS